MAILLDGKQCAEKVFQQLQEQRNQIKGKIRLGIVMVGDDGASSTYVAQKKKFGERLNIEVEIFSYETSVSVGHLRQEIGRICRLPHMAGVLVQLPLPASFNRERVLNAILPTKDVDVLGRTMFGSFAIEGGLPRESRDRLLIPPTPGAILRLLEEYQISVEGKHIVIVGAGRLVGLPTAVALLHKNATVTVINEKTEHPEEFTKQADILITGTSTARHITGDMVKNGAVVIDAGYGETKGNPNGAPSGLAGNVIFEQVEKKASYITPVPGGVGPVTVAMLFENLLKLAKMKKEK